MRVKVPENYNTLLPEREILSSWKGSEYFHIPLRKSAQIYNFTK